MAPVTKDSGTLTANGEASGRSGSATASPSESSAKPQPVALEVPISVNGVRTMEGSDKREPFSETTKTVMVYGSGAVIRLTSGVAPGQLLFLTNERTKKEVVCQVVKSKNYRNVSGYVELEFTEPAVGFWGMRFPGDRIGPVPQIAATPSRPAANGGSLVSPPQPAPKIEPPSANANVISGNGAAKPTFPAPVNAKTASSIAPANNSGPSLGASKSKPVTPLAPAKPITTTLPTDSGLVEPWLKKPASGFKAPASQPIAAPPKTSPAASEAPAESSISPTFDSSRTSDKAASIFAPAQAASNLANIDLSSLAPFFEVKPAASTEAGSPEPLSPTAAPPAPAASPSDSETEDLKQHTARLQEELAKMKFAEPASSAPEKPAAEAETLAVVELAAPLVETNSVHENKAQILDTSPSPAAPILADITEPAPVEAAVEEVKAEPAAHILALESMEQEELKVPAWLEPLTRNTSAPSSTGELIRREKTKRVGERRPKRETPAAPLAFGHEPVAESRVPQFGSELPFRESRSEEAGSAKKSGKGLAFAAIAAVVALLAAAGWWYKNQQAGASASASVSSPQAQAGPAAGQNLQVDSPSRAADQPVSAAHEVTKAPQGAAAARDSKAALNSANELPGSERAGRSNKTGRDSRAASASNEANGGSVVATSDSKPSEVVPAEEKKPVLGAVHLAAPKVSQKKNAQSGVAADAGISLDSEVSESDDAGASLGIASKQPAAPAAPVVVGGDVKQAKLISSVAPVYPALAKAQHISGDVTVDALIDANGRVTTMKVISGPTLLHQAAMDALKQWRYQPAILDGKPVPMHLSVTLQFRLQQ